MNIKGALSKAGSMIGLSGKTSAKKADASAKAVKDGYSGSVAEPELTKNEAKALKMIKGEIAKDGFKIGVTKVGLKFGAIQGAFLALGSMLTMGVVPGLALGIIGGAGSALILGGLYSNKASNMHQGYVKDMEKFFRNSSEESSMNLVKMKHPRIAEKMGIKD